MLKVETRVQQHVTQYARHKFASLPEATFDTKAYSRLKFGSNADATDLGYDMAADFASRHWSMLTQGNVAVIPAPTTSVPVAATLLGWHFHNRLSSMLDDAGNIPIYWDTVHRAATYNDNYAELPLAARQKLLEEDERHVNVSFLRGKHLLFVDDARITGTHEHKLLTMLQRLDMTNPVTFAVYAEYTGDQPSVEHQLNHTQVRDGFDVATLASMDTGWRATTRALRLLLQTPVEEFPSVIRLLNHPQREMVYHAAVAKGYSKHPPYHQNFTYLRRLVR